MTNETAEIIIKKMSRIILQSLFIGGVAVAVLIIVYKLWQHDLSVPLYYSGDALFNLTTIKGVVDNGWYLTNPFIGAPFGSAMADFPRPYTLNYFIVLLISFLVSDPGLIMNLYYFLGFILAAISAYWVLRQFSISFISSSTCAIVFSFLPYHFMRNQNHLFLADYYIIPLVVMVCLYIYEGRHKLGSIRLRLDVSAWLAVAVCLIAASSGVYYAVFALFLFMISGLGGSLQNRERSPLLWACLLSGVLLLGLLLNMLPNIIYMLQEGRNYDAVDRHYQGAIYYGLDIVRLYFPAYDYGILNIDSQTKLAMDGERNNYLGMIGGAGLVILLGALLRGGKQGEKSGLLFRLSLLTLFSILLATVSGFGVMISMFISPLIRAYSRIGIFIAFFCLFAAALATDALIGRCTRRWIKYSVIFGIVALGVFSICDHVRTNKTSLTAPVIVDRAKYQQDRIFFSGIQNKVKPGIMVFQLPYTPFPEGGELNKLADYELLKPYLHTHNIFWSFGAVKGRSGDLFLREISELEVKEMIEAIAHIGFGALYIDRRGYADQGKAIEKVVASFLQAPPIISADNNYLFFDMTEYVKRLRRREGEAGWETIRRGLIDRMGARITPIDLPLEKSAFKGRIALLKSPGYSQPGGQIDVKIVLTNNSMVTWNAGGTSKKPVHIAYHILDDKKKMIIYEGIRTRLPYDIEAGKTVPAILKIQVPNKRGLYYVEIDLVQESVAWFGDNGFETLKMPIVVRNE